MRYVLYLDTTVHVHCAARLNFMRAWWCGEERYWTRKRRM
jgi:hypothetical protein